jgi:hypothetical protein
MAKVTLHEGLTFSGEKEYSSFRVDVTIADIDTEGNVGEQLKQAVEALEETAIEAEGALATQAANVSGLAIEGAGVGAAFANFREKFAPMWASMLERITALEPKVKKARKTKKGRPGK